MLLFLNTTTADTIRAISLLEAQTFVYPSIILLCSMVFFLKDRIGLDSLKLGLEVANGTTMRTAVGATTGIGEIVAIVLRLITRGAPDGMLSSTSQCRKRWILPITFTSTFLLHLLWVGVNVTRLGEVARKVLGFIGSAIRQASMVTVILLVGASH